MMVFNTIIVLLQVCLNGLDGILHSLIIIFLVSVTVDRTVITWPKGDLTCCQINFNGDAAKCRKTMV